MPYYPTPEEIGAMAVRIVENCLRLRPIADPFQVSIAFHTPEGGFRDAANTERVVYGAIRHSLALPPDRVDLTNLPVGVDACYDRMGAFEWRVVRQYEIYVDAVRHRIDLRYQP
jgi:hypothetical protein